MCSIGAQRGNQLSVIEIQIEKQKTKQAKKKLPRVLPTVDVSSVGQQSGGSYRENNIAGVVDI